MAEKAKKRVPIRTQMPKAWFAIFGGTIVVGIGFLLWHAGSPDPSLVPKADVSGLHTAGNDARFAVTPENIDERQQSPAYTEMISELDDQALKAAESTGTSFVTVAKPTYSEPTADPDPSPAKSEPQAGVTVAPEHAEPEAAPASVVEPNALMLAFLDERQKNWAPYAKHTSYVTEESEPLATPAAGTAVTDSKEPIPPQLSELRPGDLLYVSNDVALNSDFSINEVIGTVQYGPLTGSIVMGQFKHNREGSFVVTYNRLVKPDGSSYAFKGYAIDMKTQYLAVASDVDHHYFERWGGLIAASLLKGAANAVLLENSTTQTVTNASGTTTTTEQGELDSTDAMLVTAGEVGEELSDIMRDNFNRPTTSKLYGNILLAIKVFDVTQGAQQ